MGELSSARAERWWVLEDEELQDSSIVELTTALETEAVRFLSSLESNDGLRLFLDVNSGAWGAHLLDLLDRNEKVDMS
jgi:hypothetical protein